MADGFRLSDPNAERELALVHWVRQNSTPMWIGIDEKHKIAYVDERLAHRLGYHGVHTAFLGKDLNDFLSEMVIDHQGAALQYIKDGSPPLPLTRPNPEKFVMVGRDTKQHKCFVKVRTMEDNFCAGFCTSDSAEGTRIYGMAEVTFYDDLPAHVQKALEWYTMNRGLIETVESRGGISALLGNDLLGD